MHGSKEVQLQSFENFLFLENLVNKAGHQRNFELRFAGGSMMARRVALW